VDEVVVELMRTNDVVFLGFLEALLKDAGVEPIVLDLHASVMDGSVVAIPRRLMVAGPDAERARRVLAEAGVELGRPP
jgi:hypothetical protein